MQADVFFDAEEHHRINGSGSLRALFGYNVSPFSQEEAERYMRGAVACPRCGGPVKSSNGYENLKHCRSCAQELYNVKKKGWPHHD